MLHARGDAGGAVELAVDGEIDMATADDLEAALLAAVTSPGVTGVVVDVAGVTFCDSSGLAVLDRAHAAASRKGVRLRLVNARPAVRQVLMVVDMWEALTQP